MVENLVVVEADKDKADLIFKAEPTARVQSAKIQIVGTSSSSKTRKVAAMTESVGGAIRHQMLLAVTIF